MSDPDVQQHIVRDISGSIGDSWRWTGPKPQVKLALKDAATSVKYTADFSVAGATFKETGPVTVTFLVNDQVLDRVRYAEPGDKHFEKPVPASWLNSFGDTTLGIEPDKVWTSPGDGAKLGLILTRIGLAANEPADQNPNAKSPAAKAK